MIIGSRRASNFACCVWELLAPRHSTTCCKGLTVPLHRQAGLILHARHQCSTAALRRRLPSRIKQVFWRTGNFHNRAVAELIDALGRFAGAKLVGEVGMTCEYLVAAGWRTCAEDDWSGQKSV